MKGLSLASPKFVCWHRKHLRFLGTINLFNKAKCNSLPAPITVCKLNMNTLLCIIEFMLTISDLNCCKSTFYASVLILMKLLLSALLRLLLINVILLLIFCESYNIDRIGTESVTTFLPTHHIFK